MKLEFYRRYLAQNSKANRVSKELMILNGTGIASIEELIKGPSVRNAVKSIDEEYGEKTRHLPKGEKFNMVYRNYARGASLLAEVIGLLKLEQTVDKMCLQIPGFIMVV
jgi:hypothetical protein